MNKDLFFLSIAKKVATQSKCLSRQIGAVIVSEDNTILGTGWNGIARGISECNKRDMDFFNNFQKEKTCESIALQYLKSFSPNKCPRRYFGYESGQGLHLCSAIHAEVNAIINCAREGIRTKGTKLYVWCKGVCKDCMAAIINAGIKELIYLEGEYYDKYSPILEKESGIVVRKYKEEDIICHK